MNIIQDFIPKTNKTSRPGYFMKPEYITIHNTGNPKRGADAFMHTEYVDTATGYVSWHFSVDDKVIYQELPTNENAWAAGDGASGPGNRKSIHIEICMNEGIDHDKAEENAKWLIRKLMKDHGIPLANVVPHKHWSGKNCPVRILSRWDAFIKSIPLDDGYPEGTPQWKKDLMDWFFEEGLLTDKAWKKKLEEPLPAWALAAVLKRMGEK